MMTSLDGHCNICGHALGSSVFHLASPSLNSLCQPHSGSADLRFCDHCGHLQTTPLPDAKEYYESQYSFHTESLDEDRVYVDKNGEKKFETRFRAEIMASKLDIPPGSRVLDFGCGKASTVRHLLDLKPGIELYLYDLTSSYVEFWRQFVNPAQWSVGSYPTEWLGSFDVVTCFYAFEHMDNPVDAIREIHSLSKPGGRTYIMVPDVHQNPADFLAIDHTQHFSVTSMRHLLESNGFSTLEVDDRSFHSAIITVGKANSSDEQTLSILPRKEDVAHWRESVTTTGTFWNNAAEAIRSRLNSLPADERFAIYGAGFYGAYVATHLPDLSRVEAFVDQNPFLRGKTCFGRPIVQPNELNSSIQTIFVGLNPRIARRAIETIDAWRDRKLTPIYLD